MKKEFLIMLHGMNTIIIDYFLYDLNIKNRKLTFDDGLASLYKYRNSLKELSKNNKIILFINPYFVNEADKLNKINIDFIECKDAHLKAKNGNFEHYLNSKMIKELSEFCEIGLHGWNHFLDNQKHKFKNLTEKINYYKKDIKQSCDWYTKYFKLEDKISFAWPYNKELIEYKALQNQFYKLQNIKVNYYGKERETGWWNYYTIEN